MSPKTFPIEVLRRAFPGIKPDEADEMVASGMICTYPANMVLCHEGAAETTFYIILDGEVEVTKVIGEDQNRILKHLFRGDFFGEMALIHDAPRAATVTTVSQVAVLEIRKEHFTELLQKSQWDRRLSSRETSQIGPQQRLVALQSGRSTSCISGAACSRPLDAIAGRQVIRPVWRLLRARAVPVH